MGTNPREWAFEYVEVSRVDGAEDFPLKLKFAFARKFLFALKEAANATEPFLGQIFLRSHFIKFREVDDQTERVLPRSVDKLAFLEKGFEQ